MALEVVSDPAGVQIRIYPVCHAPRCYIPDPPLKSNQSLWPAPFDSNLSRERICSIVDRLLRADGQASHDVSNGFSVSSNVRLLASTPPNHLSEMSSLSSYRLLRLTGSDLIRPMLLEKPTMEFLRPFQVDGVNWLGQHPKAVLADDMGLGKTVQAIYALRLLFNEGQIDNVMVVCPKSLLANWEHEFTKWAPELSRVRLVPKTSIREDAWRIVLPAIHVVLTNYEQVRNPPNILRERGVDVIIADEAHRIRNIGSQVAQGLRKVPAGRFWALTGTPVERDPEDLATILSVLDSNRFSVSDKRLHPASLRSQARPYILRRLKAEVLSELPEVWESQQVLDLLPGQRKSYDRVLRRVSDSQGDDILATINELRAICDYDEATGESVKSDRIMEIIEDVVAAGEKAVVFSYLLKPLDNLQERLEKRKIIVLGLRGSMSPDERQEAIDEFKTRDCAHVILCSLRVAGEGLTLTEANHVAFLNEWWNPSANSQARDRVVRIGQRKGVRVYKFKCRNTIEENLEDILDRKSRSMVQLVDMLADKKTSRDEIEPLIPDPIVPRPGPLH